MSNPQITCPQCGVFNEISDTKCWKCKRPISDEEKQQARDRVLNSLPNNEREQYLEREARKKTSENSAVDIVVSHTDYTTSILVAKLVSAIGWVTCVVAVVIIISAFASAGKMGTLALAALVPGLAVLIGGLILVIAGQSSRAVMDNTNYSRQMLEEMRKKA